MDILMAAVEVAEGHWLSWVIGGGVGTVGTPIAIWKIWSWLRKRASMSATIKIGGEPIVETENESDSFDQEECDKKHSQIETQLKQMREENRDMHVAMDDGFTRVSSRLDTVNTRMDNIFEHLLKEKGK